MISCDQTQNTTHRIIKRFEDKAPKDLTEELLLYITEFNYIIMWHVSFSRLGTETKKNILKQKQLVLVISSD